MSSARTFVIGAILLPLAGCLSFHRGPMPGEPTDARFADLQGVRVRYVDTGEGPAVVLLHGFASSIGLLLKIALARIITLPSSWGRTVTVTPSTP